MKLSHSLLKLLNIRHDEQPVVLNLMAFQFFQGAGIAFFFTATFAMFLERFSVNELPLVFILAAILLFFTGWLYSWLEHRMKITQLGMLITAVMVISILGFRIAYASMTTPWLLTLMLAWFYVLYLLNNLEFWGIASIMFDVRQSKRLFGLISAGDIPAKFIGYTLASLLVTTIGTANLLFAGMLFILGSLPFLQRINNASLPALNAHGPSMHKHSHNPGRIKMIQTSFTSNALIERTAILAFLFSLCLFLINFIFYAEVKTAYHEDEEMARFIALFLAGSRAFALIVKMIFTGRMIAKLGFMRSLLITPVVITVFAVLIVFTGSINPESHLIFYIFGMMAISADILNSAIHLPGFLTLMQPLSTHDRLRAHNIVKGLMDPFAYLLTGIFLLLMIHFSGHINLLTLNYVLLFLVVFWVIGIFWVNSQYLKTLVQSITTRTFNNEGMTVVDKESVRMIAGKLKDGTSLEKIYLLKLLGENPEAPDLRNLILLALKDPSPTVKQEAIRLLLQLGDKEALDLLKGILRDEEDPHVLEISLGIMCKLEFDDDLVLSLANHHHEVVRHSAIAMMLKHVDCRHHDKGEKMLLKLVVSPDPAQRRSAAMIISKQENPRYSLLLMELIHDTDEEVNREAIIAAGKTADDEIIMALLRQYPHKGELVTEALLAAGETAVPHIHTYIRSEQTTSLHVEKLIRICGRIGGVAASGMLTRIIAEHPGHLPAIIEALRKCRYKAHGQGVQLIEKLIQQYLDLATHINVFMNFLDHGSERYALMHRAMQIEKETCKDALLDLFSFLYNPADIGKIKKGLISGKKESIANALELIEMTVPHRIALPFLGIFEQPLALSVAESKKGQKLSLVHWNQLCNAVLQKNHNPYNAWTVACCMHTLAHEKRTEFHHLAEYYLESENLMIRETAIALTRIA